MLDEVNNISSGGEGITRLAYTEYEEAALEWFIKKCEAYSIKTHRDSIGNAFGTVGPTKGDGILIGSHLDTVKNGGRYDGALGVIAGLEVLITLIENDIKLERPVTVVSFRGEEANILGGTFGSRAFCELIDYNENFIRKLKNTPFNEKQVKDTAGYQYYKDYIELHIEQGKKLETNELNIGVVNAIAGIKRLDITVHGEAGHSGTIGMNERNDALTHTAKILLEFDRIVKDYGEPNIGTVGELYVEPNLPNVVPGKVNFILEVRGTKIDTIREITEQISTFADNNYQVTIKPDVEKHPASLSEKIINIAEEVCKESNINYQVMMSGANHDANSLSNVMDSGLLFIPCLNGISHNPKEFAEPSDMENGANILLGTTLKLMS